MLICVTGMKREARLFPEGSQVVVAGGDNAGLGEKIEAAIARGGRAIVSAGICGGLKPGLKVGDVVIASEVVSSADRFGTDAAWRSALLARIEGAVEGVLAGRNQVFSQPAVKQALHADTGAIALDMESHIAARYAATHGLPFAVIRAVSDAAEDALPPAVAGAIGPNGNVRLGRVLASVARRPGQIPALIATGRNSDAAMRRLLGCFDLLGIGLGCPHLG